MPTWQKTKCLQRGVGTGNGKALHQAKAMIRYDNLYDRICSFDNLVLADQIARRGKAKQAGVQEHDRQRGCNLLLLQEMLITGSYRTSAYKTFLVHDPKEREVSMLPFFPDRIAHHAIMNILEPVFMLVFTKDTYSCIKGQGIHAAARKLKRALANKAGTTYCLKLDITKFYPSVDHDILKLMLRWKFKDERLLDLLDEIIDSAPGVPIGNYLSQYFANFYLAYFDHWVKEDLCVKYYFRYADDIVILLDNKAELHRLRAAISEYLACKLKLEVKDNYQVFPVAERGIDFLGYVFYHTHTLLRKSIKQSFARAVAKGKGPQSLASYRGWAKHANTKNLLKKLDEQLQRPGHNTNKRRLYRGKGKDQQSAESANYST